VLVSSEPKPGVSDTSRDYVRGQDGLWAIPSTRPNLVHRLQNLGIGDAHPSLPFDLALRHVRLSIAEARAPGASWPVGTA
jgi:hypothetical protein